MALPLAEDCLIRTFPCSGGLSGYAAAWALDLDERSDLRINFLEFPAQPLMRSPEMNYLDLWAGSSKGTLASLFKASEDLLSDSELGRARKFVKERDAKTFLIAHSAIRQILASRFDCSPSDIHLKADKHGKPFVFAIGDRSPGETIHFNLSHSADCVLIGVSSVPVGVDLEEIRSMSDCMEVAKLAFAPSTLSELRASQGIERDLLFYRLWVLGEAYIKATGLGISQGLTTFSFTAAGEPKLKSATPGFGPTRRWRFGLLPVADHCLEAVR